MSLLGEVRSIRTFVILCRRRVLLLGFFGMLPLPVKGRVAV